MATFYRYAERSAESQVNWAEIGKNMTDMLRQEVAVREEKKAAIDEATRKYAEELSNAPQGEHVGAREEALRFADQATQYMLMQENLLKNGLLDPKDYMIARQNLVDGTRQAFQSMKAFQEQYSELMERAQTDKSSILEIQALEEIQGYGNFRQSGFFIDSPTGKVNVGLKQEQDIDGQKVIGLKSGSTRGMQYIQSGVYGRIDRFKYIDALKPISESMGVEIQSLLDPPTLMMIGSITTTEDLRLRKDISADGKEILFDFYSSVDNSVKAALSNPLHKASLLADTLGYRATTDPEAAAKDPKLILKVTDPNTGRAEYRFSKEQDKAAEKFMTQQLLGMINRKIEVKPIGQLDRRDPPRRTTPQENPTSTRTPRTNPITRFENTVSSDLNDANLVQTIVDAENDAEIRDELNRTLAVKYPGLNFNNAYTAQEIFIEEGDGRPKSPYYPVGNDEQRRKALKDIQLWIQKNYLKGEDALSKEMFAEDFLGTESEGGVYDEFND
jgi:hypothetical protein